MKANSVCSNSFTLLSEDGRGFRGIAFPFRESSDLRVALGTGSEAFHPGLRTPACQWLSLSLPSTGGQRERTGLRALLERLMQCH